MNIHKHMEAIFLVTLTVIGVGSFALDSVPKAEAKPVPVARNLAAPGAPAVVIVHGYKTRRHA